MKKINFIVLFAIIFSIKSYAQNLGLNVSGNLAYISINENFADNLKRNIESPRSIRLEENAISFGAEAYGFFKKFMGGGGFHRFSIKSGRDDRMSITTFGIYGMVGYNFSKNSNTQLIAAVRGGVMRNNLVVPYVSDEKREFGNALVKDDSRFMNTSILAGGAITANRHFGGGSTGFSIGIGAFYDVAVGGTNWYDDGVLVENLDLSTYSYYGLCLKLSGGWNQYDDY